MEGVDESGTARTPGLRADAGLRSSGEGEGKVPPIAAAQMVAEPAEVSMGGGGWRVEVVAGSDCDAIRATKRFTLFFDALDTLVRWLFGREPRGCSVEEEGGASSAGLWVVSDGTVLLSRAAMPLAPQTRPSPTDPCLACEEAGGAGDVCGDMLIEIVGTRKKRRKTKPQIAGFRS